LVELPLRAPRGEQRGHVYLVAGHANASDREGNTGVHGQIEAEVSLATSLFVADAWEQLDRFDVTVGRRAGERPTYPERLAHAEEVGADLFIDLHTDARGPWTEWAVNPDGEAIYRNDDGPGFSVLYNASGALGPRRRAFARLVADRLAAAGFPAYDGADYTGLYTPDPTPGVFVDDRGLMMLRRPVMPSIIIETHNAKDFEESLRWRERRTHLAFTAALTDAVLLWFAGDGAEGE
jgi:N-acetylmuramoyl-L-alanine amidase